MSDKILISGITGFVGTNLSLYLKNKFTIYGVSRKKMNASSTTYNTINKDDLDDKVAFVHLAGKAHDLKKVSDDEEYFRVNTDLTIKLFDLFLESNCKKFIFISSVKAVADNPNGILTEEVMPNPKTVYGKSKLVAEEYVRSRKLPKNKKIYILRPCMIHGPNNKGNFNLLYAFVSKGMPYPFGKYENQRSFLSIHNLCFVIQELIENDIPAGVYNVADDTPLSTNRLVTIIGRTIDKKVMIFNVPKFLVNLLGSVGNFIPLPINSERIGKLTENYVVSNSKIKKALNKNMPLTTEEGMRLTIRSFSKSS